MRKFARFRTTQKPDYTSKDSGDGYVYLVEAVGFHGPLARAKKRLKIGLTNNPERRLSELNSEQAPCKIVGIRYIQVINNQETEKRLHHKFKRNRKHGEWFDFWVWEIPLVNRAYDKEIHKTSFIPLSNILAVGGVAAISFSISLLAVQYWTANSQTTRDNVTHLK
jgi:hypothetical protein